MIIEPESILYSKQGPIANIVLNRPRVINAYNVQMRDDLHQVLEAVRDDPEVRVAILSGAGYRGFCVGADLNEFGTAPSQIIARRVRWARDTWALFLSIRKPLIAALHGFVIGSGVEIACLCDVRIASEDAVFNMPETALGMIPSAGGTQTLPRVIGLGRALELLLTNRRLKANEAERLGLVHKVVPSTALLAESKQVATALVSHNPEALSAIKTAIIEGMDLSIAQGVELERRLYKQLLERKDKIPP